jgi:hypothetical protein
VSLQLLHKPTALHFTSGCKPASVCAICVDLCVPCLLCLPSPHGTAPAVLPPGRFMSQGLVRLCPQGFWRTNHVAFDSPSGTNCTSCRPGITTDGPGATSAAACGIVEAGYGTDIFNVTSGVLVPDIQQRNGIPSGGLPAASLCDFGYYSSNGYCFQCPYETVTRTRGATSVEECSECPWAVGGGIDSYLVLSNITWHPVSRRHCVGNHVC